MRKILNGLLIIVALFIAHIAYASDHCYGPTAENEHLYRIATQVKPDNSVTVQQTMLALLRANPNAFNGNNINGLKSGYRLHIPSIAIIRKLSPESAIEKVSQQNKSWQGNRRLETTTAPIAKRVKNVENSKRKHEKVKVVVEDKTVSEPLPKAATSSSAIELANNQSIPATNIEAAPQAQIPAVTEVVVQSEQEKQFQEQTRSQITALQQKTDQMQTVLNQVTQNQQALTDRFIQMNAQNSKKSISYQDYLVNNLKKYGPLLAASLLGLIILLYLLKRTFSPKTSSVDTKKDEYDYLGSEESIPTKLDLARAYVDMGDDVAAKNVLNEVLTKGNDAQRQEAQDLLNKLNHPHE